MQRNTLLAIFCVSVLVFAGCSSGSSGSFNPSPGTSATTQTGTSTSASTSFSNVSTASGKFSISLTLDRAAVDTTVGQVLATATVARSDKTGLPGLAVTFTIAAGPAGVAIPTTLSTDSNGQALAIITPSDAAATTNVIVEAATTVSNQTIKAYAPFQIVRGTGVVTFITGKSSTDPDGTLITLDKTFEADLAGQDWYMLQQLPFKVTDGNGNPRAGVGVTLSIFDQNPGNATVTPIPTTIVTDSTGQGIFNVTVLMRTPNPGYTRSDSIIYKAVTTEASGIPALTTYAGFIISYTTKPVEVADLKLTPETASFGAEVGVAKTIQFMVAGGTPPYRQPVSGSPLITLGALTSSGTFSATCSDPSKIATGTTLSISIADSKGKTASATINGAGPVPAP